MRAPHFEQGTETEEHSEWETETETEGHSQGATEIEEHPELARAGSSSNAADPPQSSP